MQPKKFTMTGGAVPSLAAIDKLFEQFMTKYDVPCGQMSIGKNGAIKFARAYTYEAANHRITEPFSLFRLASVSKAFTASAIDKLVSTNRLKLTEKAFPLLGIKYRYETAVTIPAMNGITVEDLVNHKGGWDSKVSGFDPIFSMRKIALDMGLPGPPTKRHIAEYMYGLPTQHTPGTVDAYSNAGYLILGLVVEAASGMPHVDYIRSDVLGPEGITDLYVSRTVAGSVWPREVSYKATEKGPNAAEPHSNVQVGYAYGGEGWLTELMDAGGGMMSTATTLVRFIHSHAVWGIGGRRAGFARTGSMAGTSSYAVSRPDDVDFCFIFNTREFPSNAGDVIGMHRTAIDNILNMTPLS